LVISNDHRIKGYLLELLKNFVLIIKSIDIAGFDKSQSLKDIGCKIFESWAIEVYVVDPQSLDVINTMITHYPEDVEHFYQTLWENLKKCVDQGAENNAPCLVTLLLVLQNLSDKVWVSELDKIWDLAIGVLNDRHKEASELLKVILSFRAVSLKGSYKPEEGIFKNLIKQLTELIDSSSKENNAKESYLSIFGTIILKLRNHLSQTDRLMMLNCIKQAFEDEGLVNSSIHALQGYKSNPMVDFVLDRSILGTLSLIFSKLAKIYEKQVPSLKLKIINVFYGFSMIGKFTMSKDSINKLYLTIGPSIRYEDKELAQAVLEYLIDRKSVDSQM